MVATTLPSSRVGYEEEVWVLLLLLYFKRVQLLMMLVLCPAKTRFEISSGAFSCLRSSSMFFSVHFLRAFVRVLYTTRQNSLEGLWKESCLVVTPTPSIQQPRTNVILSLHRLRRLLLVTAPQPLEMKYFGSSFAMDTECDDTVR